MEGQQPKPKSLIEQIADRHEEIESLIKVAAKAYREAAQRERKHEWYLSALLVAAVLAIIALSAGLSWVAGSARMWPSSWEQPWARSPQY